MVRSRRPVAFAFRPIAEEDDASRAARLRRRPGIRQSFSLEPASSVYSRTQNDNGSFNIRCLDCLMTIASCVENEQELEWLERRHICPEKALYELQPRDRTHENGARNPALRPPG